MNKTTNTTTLLQKTSKLATNYLNSLEERSVFPSPKALNALEKFDFPLPNTGQTAEKVLETLHKIGNDAVVSTVGGRYFGFVTGGVYPAALAANWLTSTWDENPCMGILSPLGKKIGKVTGNWLKEAFGLSPDGGVGFVTGATMANFTGLAAARHALLKRKGWNVEEDGLFGAPKLRVIVGEEVHVSLLKALSMLGLGAKQVIRVPADEQGRLIASALPELDDATIICLQVGNVNSGAIDPIKAVCEEANKKGAWVHIDGAFGVWAAVSPKFRDQTEGIELADSIATDLHKWLNVSYDGGLIFVKNANYLRSSMSMGKPKYLPGAFFVNTPEMSRRAREIEAWAVLYHLGKTGLAELIERCCAHATTFATGLTKAGFEVLNDVRLNQVLVSFGTDEQTKRVMKAIQKSGVCWCGGTVWKGRFAMRISVSSWATTDADVEKSLAEMIRIGKEKQ